MDRRVSMMAEFAVLEAALGKRSTVVGHQEVRVESATGGRMSILACWSTPVQIAMAKGHCRERWSRVSFAAEQRGQSVWDGSPLRNRRSAVQQWPLRASQAWKRDLNGAKECHSCRAPGSTVEPLKKAQ
jgi:hypothetical protein